MKKLMVVCEKCKSPIMKPSNGFTILGSIGEAAVDEYVEIIGNSLPKPDENGLIKVSDIQSQDFCKNCLSEILKLKPTSSPRVSDSLPNYYDNH